MLNAADRSNMISTAFLPESRINFKVFAVSNSADSVECLGQKPAVWYAKSLPLPESLLAGY